MTTNPDVAEQTPADEAGVDETIPASEKPQARPGARSRSGSAGSSGEDKRPDGPAKDKRKAVRVRAGTLATALKDVAELVEAKSTVPIAGHVRFQAGDGVIDLMGTDLDAWISRDCPTDDRDGPGSKDWLDSIRPFSVTVPAKRLADVVAGFDADGMVTIEAKDDRAVVSCGRARVTLNCLPVEEFPMPPPVSVECSFEIGCGALAGAFALVRHAVSNEETRYYLNGVFVHVHDEGLRFAATDGHRLARLTLDLPEGATAFPDVIVPRKLVDLLGKLLAAAVKADKPDSLPSAVLIESALGGGRLRLSLPASGGGDVSIVAKMVDGSFPDYSRIIPHESPVTMAVNRADLDHAIRLVSLLAEEKGHGVKAVIEPGQLAVTLTSPGLGDAREELEADLHGDAFEIGFNRKYWREALAAIAADDVVMRFAEDPGGKSATVPVVIEAKSTDGEPPRLLQLLMAMRV